jgi:hypothetical protein
VKDSLVFDLLKGSAAVVALVGHRIYRHGSAPLNVVAPYATWFVVDGVPQNTLSDAPPVDRVEIQIDLWTDNTGTGARQIGPLARAVRAQVETAHDVTGFSNDQQENTTERFRATLTFTAWEDPQD